MKVKNIYSEKNIEGFVFDLIKYLYRTKDYDGDRLSKDIYIYALNRRYYVSEKDITLMLNDKIPVCIEDNIDVNDYYDFCENSPVTVSMDAKLSEYLYNYDVSNCEVVSDRIKKIFNKHGFYYDFGTSYLLISREEGLNG